MCQMIGISNDMCRHVTSSSFTLLHHLLECVLSQDVYQVRNRKFMLLIHVSNGGWHDVNVVELIY